MYTYRIGGAKTNLRKQYRNAQRNTSVREPAQHVLEVADDVRKRSDIAREHCPGGLLIHFSTKAAFLGEYFAFFLHRNLCYVYS